MKTEKEEKPPRLFKLHVGTRNGGDVTLYEDVKQFTEHTLDALIQAYGNDHRRMPRAVWMSCRSWWRAVLRRDEEDPDMRIEHVYKAQELVDGVWKDLNPELIAPSVLWHPAGSTKKTKEI